LSSFLGTFAELRKATISFVMSPRPSVHPHGTTRLPLDGFSWNFVFDYFSKVCLIQVSLKSKKRHRYFTWSHIYIYDSISLNSKCISVFINASQRVRFVWLIKTEVHYECYVNGNIPYRNSSLIFLTRNFSDITYSENQASNSMFNKYLFFGNRTVYQIIWKKIVQTDRPQMAI